MSIAALLGVFALPDEIKAEMQIADHLLLLYLAKFHNQKNEATSSVKKSCYPSMDTIRSQAGMSDGVVPISLKRLEALGLIEKLSGAGRGRGGGRRTNLYVLKFDFIYENENLAFDGENLASDAPRTLHDVQAKKESKKLVRKDIVGLSSDETFVLNKIWNDASITGKKRSSQKQLEAAFKAARKAGHSSEEILQGCIGFFMSKDWKQQGTDNMLGVHRLLTSERYLQYVGDGPKIDLTNAHAADPAAVGGPAAWDEVRQRRSMDNFQRFRAWNPENGGRPGEPGCPISDEIQREFGETPYSDRVAKSRPAVNLDEEVLD